MIALPTIKSGAVRLPPLFLDVYSGAIQAFSLRKLRSAYNGSAVRVRRSIDNAELDIGFNSTGSVSSTSLLNHCVPSVVQSRYNVTMNLAGGDTKQGVNWGQSGSDAFGLNGATRITVTGKFIATSIPSGTTNIIFQQYVSGTGSSGYRVGINTSGNVVVGGRSQSTDGFQNFTHSAVIVPGQEYTFEAYLDFTAKTGAIRLNGGTLETGALTFGSDTYTQAASTSNITLGELPSASNTTFHGIIYDITIIRNSTTVSSFIGDGNQNSNWTDQVGSVNGTVQNSPSVFTGQGYNGFVTTWYDQSTVATNAVQATASLQPRIFNNGALVTSYASKPAVSFDGVDDFLTFSTLGGSSRSVFLTIAQDTYDTINRRRFIGENRFTSSSDNAGYIFETRGEITNDPIILNVQNNSLQDVISPPSPSTGNALFSIFINTSSSFYRNTALIASSGATMGSSYTTGSIGAAPTGGFPIASRFSEVIIYNSNKFSDKTEIENHINNFWSVF